MPQLVKGGKYAYGWSRVGHDGRIVIPPEALGEYGFQESEKLILVPGSRTSGGFGLASRSSLLKTPMGMIAESQPMLWNFATPEGEFVELNGKPYGWVALHDGAVTLSLTALARYGIELGDKLLVIRGSGRALGFTVRGPIVEEAKKHSDLKIF
jgi:hypothetical protein